jgi:hypothetical protein
MASPRRLPPSRDCRSQRAATVKERSAGLQGCTSATPGLDMTSFSFENNFRPLNPILRWPRIILVKEDTCPI